MEHRPIIGAVKTGTISRREARGAARFAKSAKKKSSGGASGAGRGVRDRDHQGSSYFRFLVGPATGEPEGWEDSSKSSKKSSKRYAKKSARKKASRSAKRAGNQGTRIYS